jgi:enterochelin esterase-like enzyme
LHAFLNGAGIDHTFRETPGAHTWIVWRQFLGEFAPRLWPTTSAGR